MPTITLEFKLPDEIYEYRCASDGSKYRAVLEELANTYRSKDKHSPERKTTWDEVRRLFWETMASEGVELD